MFYQFILGIIVVLYSTVSNGQKILCPTPYQIQHNQISVWHFFDANDDDPANDEQITQFKKEIVGFWGAEYSDDLEPDKWGRCYYTDSQNYTMEIYLAAETLPPLINKPNAWHFDVWWRCKSLSPKDCPFGHKNTLAVTYS